MDACMRETVQCVIGTVERVRGRDVLLRGDSISTPLRRACAASARQA